jgi:hypothetical protein
MLSPDCYHQEEIMHPRLNLHRIGYLFALLALALGLQTLLMLSLRTAEAAGGQVGSIISGTIYGNITGQDPLLLPLQPGSPAIDVGQMPTCTDGNGATILADQSGNKRPYGPRCDIGSVEFGSTVFLPMVAK